VIRTVAIHSQRRRRRRTHGSRHSPSLRHRDAGPYTFQNASARQISVAPENHGRQASKAVRMAIQAPLMPMSTSTNGTTQQADAPMAARAAPSRTGKCDLAGALLMGAY